MKRSDKTHDAAAAATITMTRPIPMAIAEAIAPELKRLNVGLVRARPPPPKVGHTVKEATTASGLGRTSIYDAIKSKQLRAVKCGSRTIILNLVQWLESLPLPTLSPRYTPPLKQDLATASKRRGRRNNASTP